MGSKREKLFSINLFSKGKDDCIMELSNVLKSIIDKSTTIFCIGTDKVLWDLISPLTASKLKILKFNGEVIGTLERPCHALNIKDKIKKISNENVLAMDASIGKVFGDITLYRGSLSAGAGLGKDLPSIGNYSLHITTNTNKSDPYSNVIRFNDINNFSDIISKSIYIAVNGEDKLNKKLKKIDSIISNLEKE